jgi:hypothetical protein
MPNESLSQMRPSSALHSDDLSKTYGHYFRTVKNADLWTDTN